jgi:hypothetical protein
MAMIGIVIEEFKPIERNTLRGFARVRMPSGMVLHDVAIHAKDGPVWAAPASKPQVDRDGGALKDASGKVKCSPIISFTSRDVQDRWSMP